MPFYGVYDFTNRNGTMPKDTVPALDPRVRGHEEVPRRRARAVRQGVTLDHVHADAPPFFIVHGDHDTLAPVQDAREFAKRLGETSGAPTFYLELHGAQHAFDVFSSVRSRRVIKAAYRFLTVMHSRYVAGIPEAVAPSESEMVDGAVRVDDASDIHHAAWPPTLLDPGEPGVIPVAIAT